MSKELEKIIRSQQYCATVHCFNCGKRDVIWIQKGTRIGGQKCKNCGCGVSAAL